MVQRRLEDHIASNMLLTSRQLVIVFKDYSWSLFIIIHLFDKRREMKYQNIFI